MPHTHKLILLNAMLTALLVGACTPTAPPSSSSNKQTAPASVEDQGPPVDEDMRSLTDMTPQPTEDMRTPPDMKPEALTYYKDIKPIIHPSCEGCHVRGGAGPYPLDDYASLVEHMELAMGSIKAGEMPPWSPDPDCRHYKDERLVSSEQIALLERWSAEGMREGDPADWVAPGPIETPMPDLIGRQNGAYTPRKTPPDDYHCFLIDQEFTQDTFVTGTTVVPGNDQLVHHANLFLINEALVPKVKELEDAEEDAGYKCFGDPGINQTNLIGAWVPGAQPVFFPDDTAVVIPEGARLVLQVHYNALYTDPVPVESEVLLYTRDTPPAQQARALPIAHLTFDVPAGEKESEHAITIKNSSTEDWLIIGTGPHLHLLASQVKVEVLRKDDELEDTCLVDIPDWDFSWQQEYRFKDDEWVTVRPGDRVRLTCTFDNSPENQPIVDGQQLAPQRVRWGGKTNDEMCLNFLVLLQEYDQDKVNGPLCSEFKECRTDCEDPFGVGCIFNCATIETGCGECLLFGAQDCAYKYCRDEVIPTTGCLITCAQGAQVGGDLDGCLQEECPTEYAELEACLKPYIEQGLCNQYIDDCNVQF